MTTTAFLFPGQGAQYVGMGKDLCQSYPVADELFTLAESATGLPVKTLCFEGPCEDLARTDHAQVCIFTHSAAMLAVMKETLGDSAPSPEWTGGLSLGEYTALYAAGALAFEPMVKLVARRGELMQQAATASPSGMVAVMGLDESQAEALCDAAAQGQVLAPANFNCPGQIVLSGEKDAVARAAEKAEHFGAVGATVLDVAGAFHSELMRPAAEKFQSDLDAADWSMPSRKVIANVDAEWYTDIEQIPRKLLGQLTGTVRWQQCVEALLAEGMDTPYEIGPGKVLTGLVRRIDRKTRVIRAGTVDDLEKITTRVSAL